MASAKRNHPVQEHEHEQPQSSKKPKIEGDYDDVPRSSIPKPDQRVTLNPADCNLDFNIESNGLIGSALYEKGFAYCWSGARSTVGITRGKYCFSCKIISPQPVNMEDTAPDQQHVCRIGISRGDDSVGNLGETENSFGYGGTSKFSNAGKFFDYGEKFGVGDTIVCAVDLDRKPLASIGFSKNKKWLGTAKSFDAGPKGVGAVDSLMRKPQWGSAFFPHVLLKNVVVQVQFSVEEGLIPEEGYKPWASALNDENAVMGPTFSNPSDCELMMMVGLPASGKTTWAEKWVKEHPEKRYVLLGTNLILDQMKVPGLLRKNNYGERFDCLMDRATEIFNTLLSRAARVPRNYILDQTNVYKNARRRKLKPFAFFRKIAVVIFPSPEDLKLRSEKRFKEMGKEVPADAVNDMLANYILPMSKDMPLSDEYFDQVLFPEHNREESQRYLDEMKHALPVASSSDINSASSTYSRETSVQICTTPALQNQIYAPQNQVPASAAVGHWPSSHIYPPPPPHSHSMSHNYQSLNQVNPTCPYPAGVEGCEVVHQGNQNPASYWRSHMEASNLPPYWNNAEIGSARPPPFTWNDTQSGVICDMRGPHEANLQAPRATTYLPPPLPQTTYTPPFSPAETIHAPRPSPNTYSSTRGKSALYTPADHMQYPWSYAPPRHP